MKRFLKATVTLLVLVTVGGVFAVSAMVRSIAVQQTEVKTSSSKKNTTNEYSIRTDDNEWHWKHSENGTALEVKIRGQIEFAEDYSDITSISEGGSIQITDQRGGATHKFDARSGAGGIQRQYSVNGSQRAFDQEAKTWLAKVLDDTVRQGGYDARPRVRRILQRGGPNAVLQEISSLKGDYVKRIYFDELLKNVKLDDAMVRQVLRQAANEIHSDYEKAELLVQMSKDYLATDAQRTIYIEGVNTLNSDYEKGRALGALLKKGNLSADNVSFALRAAKTVSSDYERAQLLIKIAEGFTLDDKSRGAYLDAMSLFQSDYERGRVLASFIKKGALEKNELLFVIKTAPGISSDYERAQLLIKIADEEKLDETCRVAFLEAVATMSSDYEKGRVLGAFLKKGEPQKETLLLAVKTASNITSDYEKAQFLIKVANSGSSDESVRSALVNAARTIQSEYERGRVLSAVFK